MEENTRTLTEIRCPCCGIMVPVEIILHASPLDKYIEYITDQNSYIDETDEKKTWPVIHLEMEADTKRLIEDQAVEKYHDKLVKIGMAEPLTN